MRIRKNLAEEEREVVAGEKYSFHYNILFLSYRSILCYALQLLYNLGGIFPFQEYFSPMGVSHTAAETLAVCSRQEAMRRGWNVYMITKETLKAYKLKNLQGGMGEISELTLRGVAEGRHLSTVPRAASVKNGYEPRRAFLYRLCIGTFHMSKMKCLQVQKILCIKQKV